MCVETVPLGADVAVAIVVFCKMCCSCAVFRSIVEHNRGVQPHVVSCSMHMCAVYAMLVFGACVAWWFGRCLGLLRNSVFLVCLLY